MSLLIHPEPKKIRPAIDCRPNVKLNLKLDSEIFKSPISEDFLEVIRRWTKPSSLSPVPALGTQISAPPITPTSPRYQPMITFDERA